MLGGIFDTIATVGTASAASTPAKFPVDMQPKLIGGAVVGPAVPPPTQGEQVQLAQGLLFLFSTSRAVKPEAAEQLSLAVAAVCGPSSALTPEQQGQAVNQILSSNTGVDPAAVPTLYGIISMFISQQPVAARRAARREQGRKVVGESIFGNYLFANDALPQEVEHPWAVPTEPSADHAEPVTPRGLTGFGAEDVAVDHAIPTGMKWLGHGIMGGRTRHGGYATSRYGEPVTGYGMGAYAPTPVKDPKSTTCVMQTAAGASVWPPEWVCNMDNFKVVFAAAQALAPGTAGSSEKNQYARDHFIDFLNGMRSGKIPIPAGFPQLTPSAAPQPSPPPPVKTGNTDLVKSALLKDDSSSQPPAPDTPVKSDLSKVYIGVGVGVLALAGVLLMTGKKKTAAAPAKAAV